MSLKSKVISYTDGGKIFWLLLTAISLVILAYLYFVNQTIVTVAERNSLEPKISEVRASIAGLESSYLVEKNQINQELAQSLGYGQASKTIYVQKKSVSVLARAVTVQ